MDKPVTFFILLLLCVIAFSCTPECSYNSPDLEKFKENVKSESLREDIKNNSLSAGMPKYVLDEIFKKCDCETKIPVTSIGSKKQLLETEGNQVYENPEPKIFLDIYKTQSGKLYIWYGKLDFYGFEVMKNDFIYFYNNEGVDTAKILYLTKPKKLKIDKELIYENVKFAEIHHREKKDSVTYWYNLSISGSDVSIEPQGYDFYPIYRMELNDEKINNFNFKNSKK
jgi:hypothetical protein